MQENPRRIKMQTSVPVTLFHRIFFRLQKWRWYSGSLLSQMTHPVYLFLPSFPSYSKGRCCRDRELNASKEMEEKETPRNLSEIFFFHFVFKLDTLFYKISLPFSSSQRLLFGDHFSLNRSTHFFLWIFDRSFFLCY